MAMTILPNGVAIPIDLTSMPNLVIASHGGRYRAVDGKIVDCGPAKPASATIITGTTHLRAANAAATKQNVKLLRDTLLDLEASGFGRLVSIEVLPDAAPRMTLKEFKAAFGDKPGVTFRCPDHLKHELEE
jgi:hypothetical protein